MFLNEEIYCEQSIRSVMENDFLDELVLVHGANKFAYFADPYGLSIDNTLEIIKSLPWYGNKLKVYNIGWVPSKRELRNAALRMLTYRDSTNILVLDLDEIWDSKDLALANDRFEQDRDLQFIHNELIQLRGDFNHYRDMSTGEQEHNLYNEQSEKQTIVCRDDTELRQGRTAERLFRWQPGMHYISHTCICDMNNRYVYIDPAYKDYRVWEPDIKFWHYNYLKPFPQVFTKFSYFAQQDGGKERNNEEAINRAMSEGYIKYLFTGTHPAGSWPVTPLPEDLTHPSIMDSHPYRHLSEREIVDPTGEWIRPEGPDREKVIAMLEDASKYLAPDNVDEMVT